MVIGTIHLNVSRDIVFKRLHESFKIIFAAHFTEVFGGEVAVHARPVPVALYGLAVQLNVDFVLLAETHQQIARRPGVIGGLGGAFGEDLKFPLAFGNLGIDAFVIDAGGKTEVPVFFDDLASAAAHVLVANPAVVGSLRRTRVAVLRETEGTPILKQEVLLLKTNPQ